MIKSTCYQEACPNGYYDHSQHQLAEQLRLHVLTLELLALPAAFAAQTDAAFAALNQRMEHVEQEVAELKAGQQRLEQDVDELKAGQQRLEAGQQRLEEEIAEVKTGQQRLTDSVGELRGDAALRATQFLTAIIAKALGLRATRELSRAETLTTCGV